MSNRFSLVVGTEVVVIGRPFHEKARKQPKDGTAMPLVVRLDEHPDGMCSISDTGGFVNTSSFFRDEVPAGPPPRNPTIVMFVPRQLEPGDRISICAIYISGRRRRQQNSQPCRCVVAKILS